MSNAVKLNYRESKERYGSTDVLVDGEAVAQYRKRTFVYTGLQRGGTAVYFDVYPLGAFPSQENRLGTDTTRKRAVAQALAALGLDDAARVADADHADFRIRQRNDRLTKETA